ncbi:MAG: preprotein translocase subunit SecA [Hyphomicrobiales bacterium]
MPSFLTRIFGSANERTLRRLWPIVQEINDLEKTYEDLPPEAFPQKTAEWRERLASEEATLDDILPEAFAAVREASRRSIGLRHFDVQCLGGIVLHQGRIAEMKTGEGKTLVATLPLYLNALQGKGAHLITVNDYLARRDVQWMGPIYSYLGLSTASIIHDRSFVFDPTYIPKDYRFQNLRDVERRDAYRADITYGTNNEFGFDYLRDNMKFSLDEYVQRELHFAIVDEVDNILIDEARTPLIISGPAEESTSFYTRVNSVIPFLKKDADYTVDEKARQVLLTEDAGIPKLERLLSVDNLYDPGNIEVLHHVNQALKAHILFHRDVDYMVKDGEVVIVDEFTGRLMPGRRWSDGLHQAVEAKEGVKIENENQTLATITFQNYFRMFDKLAGMTGTADTEAAEFQQIYKLAVTIVPTNQPMIREDLSDQIYRTEKEKFQAVLEEVKGLHEQGRPVLVGTVSIEKSERLSGLLTRHGVPHNVLNAKHHEQEAQIIAEAGHAGRVTIATNMAGRGVDIKLGEGVVEKGGLHIIGTERHESRRVDNQLRGRAGRQGDPGSSRFYLSLEDDLLRIFGSDRISPIMEKLGMEEGEPIEHPLINRAVENAQKKVEGHNFDIRKHLLEYDDVMNKQRTVIYDMRRDILGSEGLREMVLEFAGEVAEDLVGRFADEKTHPEEWDFEALSTAVYAQFGFRPEVPESERPTLTPSGLADRIRTGAEAFYAKKEADYGADAIRYFERMFLLSTVDALWKDHLLSMDHLKEGIGLRGYAQKDPLKEYQREGFDLFSDLIARIKEESLRRLFHVRVQREEERAELKERAPAPRPARVTLSRGDIKSAGKTTQKREGAKIGRNDPCPCGSGKKYKKCCGANV